MASDWHCKEKVLLKLTDLHYLPIPSQKWSGVDTQKLLCTTKSWLNSLSNVYGSQASYSKALTTSDIWEGVTNSKHVHETFQNGAWHFDMTYRA